MHGTAFGTPNEIFPAFLRSGKSEKNNKVSFELKLRIKIKNKCRAANAQPTNHKPLTTNPRVYPFFGQHVPDSGFDRSWRRIFQYFHFFRLWGRRNNGYPCRRPSTRRVRRGGIHGFPTFLLQVFAQLAAQPGDGLFHQRLSWRVFMRFCSQMILPACEFREKRGSALKWE